MLLNNKGFLNPVNKYNPILSERIENLAKNYCKII